MNRKKFYDIACIAFAFLFAFALITPGQPKASPREEKLLNGMNILMWRDPSATNVEVRLRIHAGSAFDPQNKEGVLKMLAESMFSNESTRAFFSEDLGGSFELISNYDYTQLNASSRPDGMLSMLETLAGAVTKPEINRETTDVARKRVLAQLEKLENDPKFIADQAIAARLFGAFPYGRSSIGTRESLAKIDFADLRFAYDRLFGANNATIAITGNFDPALAYRAIRRFFGSWQKSDKSVPSTFKQPEPPEQAIQLIESPEPGNGEIRYAIRGVSRSSRDYHAAGVLAEIIEKRLKESLPETRRALVSVRNNAFILPGSIIIAFSDVNTEAPLLPGMPASSGTGTKAEAKDTIIKILGTTISDHEFAEAKRKSEAAKAKIDIPTLWLDAETYGFTSIKADREAAANVTIGEVKRLAEKIANSPIASIMVFTPKVTESVQQ